MAKDPAFLFYSQDFYIEVAVLNWEDRGKYISILCLLHQQGRLKEESIRFLVGSISDNLRSMFRIDKNGLWFSEKLEAEIEKRKNFTESRRNNGSKGGRPKNLEPSDKLVENHMVNYMGNENKNVNENEILNKNSVAENSKITPLESIDTNLMGFKGKVRHWMEKEHNYIWDALSDKAADRLHQKFKELHRRDNLPTDAETLFQSYQVMINQLDTWIKTNKFSITYFDNNFNEIITGIKSGKQGNNADEKRRANVARIFHELTTGPQFD